MLIKTFMKNTNANLKSVLFVLTPFMAMNALASSLDIKAARGEKTISYTSPKGKLELCIVPQKIQAVAFSKDDIKEEDKLCGLNFYENTVVCEKQNSTNPGLLIGKMIDGLSKAQAEAKVCDGPADAFKNQAKFKQGISCSYTPSILAYYQFSRLLDAGNVPPNVMRTMDRQEHLRHVNRVLTYSKLDQTMRGQWESYKNTHANGTNKNVFDNSGNFVYGALAKNPKNESFYYEVNGRGDYETRYQRFLTVKPFLNVASTQSISAIAGGADFKTVAPVVVQMKDVSDMILLDTLLSQDDRIGNIANKFVWMSYDAQGKVVSEKSDAEEARRGVVTIPKEEEAKYNGKAVLVRQILLKDNDCGVNVKIRSNMMRQISAIEQVRHMSARTYARFINFAKFAKTPDVESYMQRELLFSIEDLKASSRSFQKNLDRAVEVLTANCMNGSLKLDANIEDFVPGATPIKVNCDGSVAK